jgi:predicted lipoprotein with Yx(FWY)xxD motif
MASQHPTFGPILVDGEGFSLYVFASDTQNGGISACTAECAAEWPPLMSQGTPVVSQGVDAAMLGTITREDGSIQVTYNGWPLYLFTGDAAPGDTNGQGMEGLWSLVSPAGAVVP